MADGFEAAEFGDSRVRLRSAVISPIRQSVTDDLAVADGDPNWWSLRTAADKTGVPISTIRGWYRRGRVTSRKVIGSHGPQVELLAGDVDALASKRADVAPKAVASEKIPPRKAPARKTTGRKAASKPATTKRSAATTPAPPIPDGSMLIPVDSWHKMLSQLGNLHEAGQQLAEARERAAKAETESMFLRERIADLRGQVAELKDVDPEPARPSEALPESGPESEPGPQPEPEPEPESEPSAVELEPQPVVEAAPAQEASKSVVVRIARAIWGSGRRT